MPLLTHPIARATTLNRAALLSLLGPILLPSLAMLPFAALAMLVGHLTGESGVACLDDRTAVVRAVGTAAPCQPDEGLLRWQTTSPGDARPVAPLAVARRPASRAMTERPAPWPAATDVALIGQR